MTNFLLYFSIGLFFGILCGAVLSFRSVVLRSLVDASDN